MQLMEFVTFYFSYVENVQYVCVCVWVDTS